MAISSEREREKSYENITLIMIDRDPKITFESLGIPFSPDLTGSHLTLLFTVIMSSLHSTETKTDRGDLKARKMRSFADVSRLAKKAYFSEYNSHRALT